MNKITKEEFIQRSKEVWGEKYDYSLVEYKNMKTKVILKCENKHIFEITPDNHLRHRNCPYCVNRINLVNDRDSFIKKAKSIHKDKYNYEEFVYTFSYVKSFIICDRHGAFKVTPNSHLAGTGCRKCYFESISTNLDNFIKSALSIHNNKYDYSLVEYSNNKIGVKIICPTHGIFKQSPSTHLNGSGCKKCMIDKFRIDFDIFVERANYIHNYKYKYDETSYSGMKNKTKILCQKHGYFYSTADNHISKKRGCKKCSNNISKMEKNWLDILNIDDKYRQIKLKLDNRFYSFDALDSNNKIVYEFYGDFFHGNPNIYKSEDLNPLSKKTYGELYSNTLEREAKLKSLGYNLVTIWEEEYKKLYINNDR